LFSFITAFVGSYRVATCLEVGQEIVEGMGCCQEKGKSCIWGSGIKHIISCISAFTGFHSWSVVSLKCVICYCTASCNMT